MRRKEIQGSDRYLEDGDLEAYLRDMIAGRHCSRSGFEYEGDCLNERWGRRLARVKALAMAVSAVRICS